MPRIRGVTDQKADLITKLFYWLAQRKHGKVLGSMRLLAHQPPLLRSIGSMEKGQGALTSVQGDLKSLAQVMVAVLTGCPCRIDACCAEARKNGVTEKKLSALTNYEKSNAFTSGEKAVLRYAVAMSRTPMAVTDEIFAEAQIQMSALQIVELTSAIAWENYRARFGHAFELESDDLSKGAFCPTPAGKST